MPPHAARGAQHLWGPALSDADVRLMAPPEAIVREHVIPFIQRFLPGVDCTAPAMVEGCMCAGAAACARVQMR